MASESVEISSDDEHVDDANISSKKKLVYKYNSGAVELDVEGLECLNSGLYLKDNIIQFYIAYLLNEDCLKHNASRTYIFDSIFFKKLQKIFTKTKVDGPKLRQLSKWYEGIDIFQKDFLIFPICKDNHWFAIVVYYPAAVRTLRAAYEPLNDVESPLSPGIVMMDSLGLKNTSVISKIRDFLDFEWRRSNEKIKRFSQHDLEDYFPDLPRQQNDYDCGLYMLMYIKCVLDKPERFYKLTRLGGSNAKIEFKSMVEKRLAKNDRESLKNLINTVCVTDC